MRPSFFKRNRAALILLTLAVALIVFAIARRSSAPSTVETTTATPPPSKLSPPAGVPPPPPAQNPPPRAVETPNADEETTEGSGNLSTTPGELEYRTVLKQSNSPEKGNYYITVNGSDIYINASRDYSDLVGKEVVFKASGTVESFTLISITATQ